MKYNNLIKLSVVSLCLSLGAGAGCAGGSSDEILDELFEIEEEDSGSDTVDVTTADEVAPATDDTSEVLEDFVEVDPNGSFGDLEAPIHYDIDHSDSPLNSRVYTYENNSARLYGPVIGTGAVMNSDNAKRIMQFGPTDSVTTRIIAAYAMRSSVYPAEQAKVMLVIDNPTSSMICHHVGGVSFTHTPDHAIYGKDFNSWSWQYTVDGATFQNATPYVNSECIPANSFAYAIKDAGQQSGYGALDPLLMYDDVTGVTGGRGTRTMIPHNRLPVGGSVKPISYDISENGLNVEITVRNEDPLYRYYVRETDVYLLDEQGLPVGHVQALGGVSYLDPGEEGIVSFSQSKFQGTASTMRVVVDPRLP